MMKTEISIIVAGLIAAGCGPAFLPDATQAPVTDANVVGSWVYTGYSAGTPATITFATNHTFVQSVTTTGGTLGATGSWTRVGANLTVSRVLMEDVPRPPAWTESEGMWWLTDSRLAPGTLAIFGGSFPDPDAYQEFRRIAGNTGPNTASHGTALPRRP